MKPATQARIDAICTAMYTYAHIGECSEEDIREAIRLALLEQDRDTRHACAEAVLSIDNPFIHYYATSGDRYKDHGFEEAKKAAHAACVNAQTISPTLT